MKKSDIRIVEMDVTFSDEPFRIPLIIGTGPITDCKYASIRIKVENRLGRGAFGTGGILLSDLWSFPSNELTHIEKVEIMLTLVLQLKNEVFRIGKLEPFIDPFQLTHKIEAKFPQLLEHIKLKRKLNTSIPKLLALVCWSAIDAAVHDAWGQAEGKGCYAMYNEHYLNEDLGYYFGMDWKGKYPADYLRQQPRKNLWVQQ